MKLEFKIYELTRPNSTLTNFIENKSFIVVGEEIVGNEEHYLLHELDKDGIKLTSGLTIQESAYSFPKRYLKAKEEPNCLYVAELNIPGIFLNTEIISDIKRLNN